MAYVLTSCGEIIDKYTILLIKREKITDPYKLINIERELAELDPHIISLNIISSNIVSYMNKLKTINLELWEIEDNIRIKEAQSQFDEDFISLARNVYLKNDERSSLKYKINALTNSPLVEEKSYKSYKS